MERGMGIGETHRRLTALTAVQQEPALTQRRLAARVGISLGLANRLLRDLEREGLVAPHSDSNKPGCALTGAGREALVASAAALARETESALDELLPGDAREVRRRLSGRGRPTRERRP